MRISQPNFSDLERLNVIIIKLKLYSENVLFILKESCHFLMFCVNEKEFIVMPNSKR